VAPQRCMFHKIKQLADRNSTKITLCP